MARQFKLYQNGSLTAIMIDKPGDVVYVNYFLGARPKKLQSYMSIKLSRYVKMSETNQIKERAF